MGAKNSCEILHQERHGNPVRDISKMFRIHIFVSRVWYITKCIEEYEEYREDPDPKPANYRHLYQKSKTATT